MRYVRVDVQQVHRKEWRAYVAEFNLFANAETRRELLDEVERHVTEQYLGGESFTLIVTTY